MLHYCKPFGGAADPGPWTLVLERGLWTLDPGPWQVASKLNVLHMHITDDQSVPARSGAHPTPSL